MFLKSVILCYILLYKVLYVDAEVESVKDTNPLIEIAEINSTDIITNNIFFWKAGSEHTIKCSILNSTEEEHIKYLDPSKNLVEGDQKGRIIIQHYSKEVRKGQLVTALRLSFNPTTTEDSGIWQCQSADGRLNKTFSICFREKLLFLRKIKYYYFARRGRSISLKCNAFGESAPLFQWYRNEELITDDHNVKYKISFKYTTKYLISTLTIINIEKEDRGLYKCKATQRNPTLDMNCDYTETINLTVKVKYAPRFKTGNIKTEFYSIPGESEHIRCDADGFPKPKYTWYRHINGSNSLELVDNTANLNLTIDESSFGEIYICRAANFEGDATKTYVVTKLLKPPGPDYISINNVGTVKSITLNWRDEIKYPIQGVDIEYLNEECKTNRVSNWESATRINLKVNEEQYNYNNSLSMTLSCLNEDRIYCIRLRVTNKAGFSSWSSYIAYNTNSLGIPKPLDVPAKLSMDYQQIFNILAEMLRIILASSYSFIIFFINYFY